MRYPIDLEALGSLFRLRVARVTTLIHLGLTNGVIAERCGSGGPWQGLFPGVLLLSTRPPTREHMLQAALLYAGRRSMVTGFDALYLYGMKAIPRSLPPPRLHVLAPLNSRTNPPNTLCLERTHRLPRPAMCRGFPIAPLERAAIDAIRRVPRIPEIRAILEEVIHHVGVEPVRTELSLAPPRGIAQARAIVGESPARQLERAVLERRPLTPVPQFAAAAVG